MSQQKEILRLLEKNSSMTQGDLSIAMYGDNKHRSNIYDALMSLVDNGKIIRTGSQPSYYSLNGVEPAIQVQEEANINVHPKIKYGSPLQLDNALNSLATQNNIEMDSMNNLVKLTKSNSRIIENLIRNDYGYIPFANMIYNQLCSENSGSFPNTTYAWTALVRIIDLDNSTQVWRFHRPVFHKIIDYIVDPSNNFIYRLSQGDVLLVDEIKKSMQSVDIKSLPSKICKYTSEYMNFGDNYFINDYYVRSMLPFYLDYYRVDWSSICTRNCLATKTDREALPYQVLYSLLNVLLEKVNENEQEKLTKNELDHIIWYCYKNYSRD